MARLEEQGLNDPALDGIVPIPGPPEQLDQLNMVGRWPRMLVLDEATEKRLVEYLDREVSYAWQERDTLVEDWIQWQKDYWAKPDTPVRNFPFKRAANVVIPLTAIAVEAIYARLLNTIFSVKPFWSMRPRTKVWVDAAPEIERWLQVEAEDIQRLDAYGFASESLLELIKFGTGIGKSGYERDVRKINVDLPDGTIQERWIERKNGPTLDYVPLANFLMRLSEKDPQTADWVGEEHRGWTWAQLKREALSGRIRPEALEAIKTYWNSQNSSESPAGRLDNARRSLENAEPAWHESFDFCELWVSFDVDLDGVDEEIVVDFHKPSGTLLSTRYNWYSDVHRPYRIGVYIPVEGRWAGIGVGKQNEQFQPLVTTIHRQRLDAGTLANMGQVAIKKSSGYGPGEPIFPGKMWFLDDVEDIKEFHLSNTQHFSQIQNEEAAVHFSDKRVGTNDLILGIPHQGTPGTATTDMAKLAEGNKKFDMVLKNVRRWFSLLGEDVVANFQQFGNQDRHWLVQDEKGEWVERFLQLPIESVRKGAAIDLTITDSITNKDVEQQKWMSLFSVLSGNYNVILEKAMIIAQTTGDPMVALMVADMALRGINEATRRLLETFNIPDVDNFIIDMRQAHDQLAASRSGAPGSDPGLAQLEQQAGMAQLMALVGANGGGSGNGNGGSARPRSGMGGS